MLIDEMKMVNSRTDLSNFLSKLRADLNNNSESWENITLDSYLEALSACISDIDGLYKFKKEPFNENFDWNFIARLFLMAAYYE